MDAADNEALTRAIRSLLPAIRRISYQRFTSSAAEESVKQHDKITAACGKRDIRRAAEFVELNWSQLALVIEAQPSAVDSTA
jgi:DNA-binding GntR family transcriptional regulator